MRFVDSHLHLDSPDMERVVSYAKGSGAVLLPCGVDERSSGALLRAAAAHRGVEPFVGVHPSEATKSGELGWLEGALSEAAGVGEIGLDPSYSPTGPGSDQLKAFTAQLEAAEKKGLPVQVHSRGAEAQSIDLLGVYRLKGVLMHWLEAENALDAVIERGWFVSFSPALVYSKKIQRVAKRCDLSLALTESDNPVPYAPLGGVRGTPLVPSVAFKLGELWGKPFQEALFLTAENAMRFLGRPSKG